MSALAAIVSRLTALEEEVKTLRTPSLAVFMDCLKTASPEEIKEWMDLCNEVAGPYLAAAEEAKDSVKEDTPKKVKVKKAATNEPGPTEWNTFVKHVRQTMAASAGIIMDGDGKAAEKEFSDACKEAGITYQAVLKEASRQKAVLEGKEPKVKVPKVKEPKVTEPKVKVKATDAEVKAKVAAAVAAKVAPVAAKAAVPVTAKAAPAKVVSSELDLQLAAAAEQGWLVVKHKGQTFFHDPNGDLAFSYPDGNDQIGTYTAATEFAEAEFVPKDEEEEDE